MQIKSDRRENRANHLRERALKIIKTDPDLSKKNIATRLGCTDSTVCKIIQEFKRDGKI